MYRLNLLVFLIAIFMYIFPFVYPNYISTLFKYVNNSMQLSLPLQHGRGGESAGYS